MPKVYLRPTQVAARYSTTRRSVYRMVEDGRIPGPDIYNGRVPLWDTDALDAADRNATVKRTPIRVMANEPSV
jgi:predicted DNA-binding transcriptional regulator AlpA